MTTTTEVHESTDRIHKQFDVQAPLARVWRAISDADEFGSWFRMKLDRPFEPGATVHGSINIPGYEHVQVEILVERVEPDTYLSYRWHPYAVDASVDYSSEPMTLVEFRLQERAEGGTAISITESGFDALPATRRAEAFRMNEGGWRGQSKNLAEYVA